MGIPLKAKSDEVWEKHYCDKCDKTLNGAHEWEAHVRSKRHRRRKVRDPKTREHVKRVKAAG